MKIAISGTTGLIGSTLKEFFLENGHQVTEITRQKSWFKKSARVLWDLEKNYIDIEALEGHDAIIHLAGANIAGQPWSALYKKEIIESRLISTQLLVEAIKKMNKRPKFFFSASAVGYYGSHDPQLSFNEHSLAGHGFLAEVCHKWETASADLVLYGVRLVQMRFGVVLSKKGGALAKMLPAFLCGVGGRLGSGRQKMSWVALDEIPHMIDFIMSREDIAGPVNFVTPNPVTNREFTKTLGKVIFRPTILPVPGFLVRLLFGEMGQVLLLEGCHVMPEVLQNAGYSFHHPQLKEALEYIIKDS